MYRRRESDRNNDCVFRYEKTITNNSSRSNTCLKQEIQTDNDVNSKIKLQRYSCTLTVNLFKVVSIDTKDSGVRCRKGKCQSPFNSGVCKDTCNGSSVQLSVFVYAQTVTIFGIFRLHLFAYCYPVSIKTITLQILQILSAALSTVTFTGATIPHRTTFITVNT